MCRLCRVRAAFGRPIYHELCSLGLWFKVKNRGFDPNWRQT